MNTEENINYRGGTRQGAGGRAIERIIHHAQVGSVHRGRDLKLQSFADGQRYSCSDTSVPLGAPKVSFLIP